MKSEKLQTITKLFNKNEIRSIWDSEKGDYYFSVVDVIVALTNSKRPRKYWNDLKVKLEDEGSQLSDFIGQLKLKSKDGKYYNQDVLDTEGILRLIESIHSPKAEPFKQWLASLGRERIDEVFDPEVAIKRAVKYYHNRGYDDVWIEKRLKSILNRNKLTDVWKDHGINEDYEYAILTNEIYQSWSGMKAHEYKDLKNIRKESLRDNMSDIEIALSDLGEIATRELTKEHNPYGLAENKKIAHEGGEVAKAAKNNLEEKLGKSIINKNNNLSYSYLSDKVKIEENK